MTTKEYRGAAAGVVNRNFILAATVAKTAALAHSLLTDCGLHLLVDIIMASAGLSSQLDKCCVIEYCSRNRVSFGKGLMLAVGSRRLPRCPLCDWLGHLSNNCPNR